MNTVGSATRVAAERRIELDIAKGIAVLLMICVHVQEMYSLPSVQQSGVWVCG